MPPISPASPASMTILSTPHGTRRTVSAAFSEATEISASSPFTPKGVTQKRRTMQFVSGPSPSLEKSCLTQATETESGILLVHLEAIKSLCREKKLCLFIRPTELASTRLIKHGYACKSVDIHAKSANGGLAKGFIPVDPGFCKNAKKLSIQPTPGLSPTRENLYLHGKATFTALFMSTPLLDECANDDAIHEIPSLRTHQQRYFTASDNSPNDVIYIATLQTTSTAANGQLRGGEWRITWVQAKPEDLSPAFSKTQCEQTPLYVYAYQDDGRAMPVTGDYDLAAIIPDKEYLSADGKHIQVEDEHGASISSALGEAVVNELNAACGHTVFRHGAETQNIHFAQPLDDKLIVITPAGFASVVPKERMADAQYDLVCRKKIIKWNPAYDRNDLPLGGQYFGVLPTVNKHEYQKNYDELTAIVGKIRLSLSKKMADETAVFKSHLTSALNDLVAAIKNPITEQDCNTLVGYLVNQLTDILTYQEALKTALESACRADAPTKLTCFDTADFFDDNNVQFIEDHRDRARWIEVIKKVSANTGDQNFTPEHPLQVSTTDSIPTFERLSGRWSGSVRQSLDSMSSSLESTPVSGVLYDLGSRASTPISPKQLTYKGE